MKFVAPEMEIKLFSTEDILTASKGSEEETTTTPYYQPDCPAELPMD